MRKPKEISYSKGGAAWICTALQSWIAVDGRVLSPKDARKLAAWLLKAADWLEEKEGEK